VLVMGSSRCLGHVLLENWQKVHGTLPLPKSIEMCSTASIIAARVLLGWPALQPTAVCTCSCAILSGTALSVGVQGSNTSRNLPKKLRSASLQYYKRDVVSLYLSDSDDAAA